jgi:hypothetical protein
MNCKLESLVLRWFRRQPKPPIQPERLLYGASEEKPQKGAFTQDYYDRYVVTRVETVHSGYWRAYGKRVGPSSGPGTKLGAQNEKDQRQERRLMKMDAKEFMRANGKDRRGPLAGQPLPVRPESAGSVPDFSKSTKESMQETLETIEFVLRKEGLTAKQRVNAIISLTISERKFGKREQNSRGSGADRVGSAG